MEKSLNDYIILPGKDRPDILVSKSIDYTGDSHDTMLSYNKGEAILKEQESFMLNLKDFVSFLKLVVSKTDIYNGEGRKLSPVEANKLYYSVFPIPNPYGTSQGEYIGIKVLYAKPAWYNPFDKWKISISYDELNSDGGLINVVEPLDNTTQNRDCDITLGQWLNSHNTQGFPEISGQGMGLFRRLRYCAHNDPNSNTNRVGTIKNLSKYGRVGYFSTNSLGDLLCFNQPPDHEQFYIGVRPAKIRK